MKRRDCPVIWAETDDPSLYSYREKGCVQLPHLLDSKTVEEIKRRANRLAEHNGPEAISEPEHRGLLRSVYNIANLDPYFASLISASPILAWARRILGSKIYIHQSHINYKKAFLGKDYYWHQDYPFWKWQDGMPKPRAISVVVFIDEHRIENGPLMYIEGSHLWEAYGQGWSRKDDSPSEGIRHHYENVSFEKSGLLSPQMLQEFLKHGTCRTLTGQPGDVFIMDGLLAHASGPNFSPYDRTTLIYVLNSVENKIIAPTRPTYISSHDWEHAF